MPDKNKIDVSKNPIRALTLPLYSTRLMAVTVPVGIYPFFITGLRAIGQGFAVPLTESETNLTASGSLPSDYNYFICNGIGVNFSYTAFLAGAASANIITPCRNILENSWIEFQSGNTRIPCGPIKMFPGGYGLENKEYHTQVAAAAADLTVYTNNNGENTKDAVQALQEELIIKGGQSFTINLHNEVVNTNTATFRMSVILYGRYSQVLTN